MSKINLSYRVCSVIVAISLIFSAIVIPMGITAENEGIDLITGIVVNGDIEDGSWYKWAGDEVIYENFTGNQLAELTTSTDDKHGGNKAMQFVRDQAFYPGSGDYGESETIAGCKTTLDEAKFAQIDLSKMTVSVWAKVQADDLQSQFFLLDVKYRAVYNNGTYGDYHTTSLRSGITVAKEWQQATALLDDMTADCENAKTIEIEIFTRSYCTVLIDDVDISAPAGEGTEVSNSLVNGDMEESSWYKWAGDEVLYGNLTGNALDGEVSTTEKAQNGNKSMRFMRDWGSFPNSGQWNESEMIAGCKTTIKEDKFKSMDLSNMTFSIWVWVDSQDLQNQFFALDVKYRAVKADGSYGTVHTSSLKSAVTAGQQWVKAAVLLDSMAFECEDAKTIEFELFTRTYSTVYLDNADVTAPKKSQSAAVNGTLVNGDMEAGSWYLWAGNDKLYGDITGAALNNEVSTSDMKHGGNRGMQFVRDWGSYPSTGDYNESEMIAGCKTTVIEEKFKDIDVSNMTFSIWVFFDNQIDGQLFALDVKYRAVMNDGSYGPTHTTSLLSALSEGGKWVEVKAPLVDMSAECENAKTIEVELFSRSYSSIYFDDADLKSKKPEVVTEGNVVNGTMEDGSWYKWAGDEKVFTISKGAFAGQYSGNELDQAVSTKTQKHSGEKAMQFVRDQLSFPNTGEWNESEMIAGCKTTVKEAAFPNLNLANLTFSIWIKADTNDLGNQFFAFDLNYRIVNNDGTYGNLHTVSLKPFVTKGGEWQEIKTVLDDLSKEGESAKTIELELFARTYCAVYLDDADITDSDEERVMPNLILNGDAEEGILGTDPSAVPYPNDVLVERDTEVKYSGNASTRMECTNENGAVNIHSGINPFSSKKRYKIEMDVKTEFPEEGGGYTYFGLLEWGPEGGKWTTIMGEETHNRISTTQDWTHFETKVSSFNPTSESLGMYIHLSGVGKVWYDNIKFTEIPPKVGAVGEVTADIESGEVTVGQEIWLTTGDSEADIYFTTDNSDPSTSPTRFYYSGLPVIVTEDLNLKAVAVTESGPGKVASYTYTVSEMLIKNGDFEQGLWEGSTVLDCTIDTSEYHSGSQSLRVDPSPADGQIESNWVKLDTRFDHELTFWAKTENFESENPVYMTMRVIDLGGNEGNYERYERLITIPNNSDWTEYKIYMNDLCYTQAKVCLSVEADSGTAWFDDVKLVAKQAVRHPISIKPARWDNFGATYYDSIYDPQFSINMGADVSNIANCEQKLTIDYYIINLANEREYPGSTVDNYNIPGNMKNVRFADGGNAKLDLSSVSGYGVYEVVFTVTDEVGATYEAGRFSVTRSKAEFDKPIASIGIAPHIGSDTYDDDRERLILMRQAGIGSIRLGMGWDSVEKEKGVYTFDARYDELLELINEMGMDSLFLLGFTNKLYNNNEFPTSDEDIAAFAKYCAESVRHYKQFGIKNYELWNEYDYHAWLKGVPFSGAVDYTRMIKAAYVAMKQVDPDCVIVTACTSGVNYNFVKKMMDEGAYNYTDAISLHPYSYQISETGGNTPESGKFIERCKEVYDMVNSYGNGPKKKIWISEFGFPTPQNFDGQTEAQSAMNVIRSYALAIANSDFIEKAYIYEEVDRLGINIRDNEHHFGINHGWSSVIPYSPKMVMPAMSAYTSFTWNAKYNSMHHYDLSSTLMNYGSIIGHEYDYADGGKLFAFYDVDNIGKKALVKLKSNDVKMYDFYGNPISFDTDPETGDLILEVNGNMTYMVLDSGNDVIDVEVLTKNQIEIPPTEDDPVDDDYKDSDVFVPEKDLVLDSDTEKDDDSGNNTAPSQQKVIRKIRRHFYTPWWVFAAIIGGSVVAVAAITITIILILRHRKKKKMSQI